MKEYYKKYLKDNWSKLIKRFINENSSCSICKTKDKLTIHHKSYENLGKEIDDDVIVLCRKCHYNIHFNGKKSFNKTITRRRLLRKLSKNSIEKKKIKDEIQKEKLNKAINLEKDFSCKEKYAKQRWYN